MAEMTGAERARLTWRERLASWAEHHRQSSRDAFEKLLRKPLATLLACLTLGLALALPAGLSLVVQNLEAVTHVWGQEARLSAFLKLDTDAATQKRLAATLTTQADIGRVEIVTPEEALAEYRQRAGAADLLAVLKENPLPPVLVVYPKEQTAAAVRGLEKRLAAMPAVDQVVADAAWIQKLKAILDVANQFAGLLTLALGLGVVLVISNTLQLMIESRRNEIIVMKTVGASNAYVRRPFLHTGFWYGVLGGLVALLLVSLAFASLAVTARDLLALYGSHLELVGLSAATMLLLPITGGVLGLLGAFLAVSRQLHELEPRRL